MYTEVNLHLPPDSQRNTIEQRHINNSSFISPKDITIVDDFGIFSHELHNATKWFIFQPRYHP